MEQQIVDLKRESETTVSNKDKIIKELKSRLKKISQMYNVGKQGNGYGAGKYSAFDGKGNRTMS